MSKIGKYEDSLEKEFKKHGYKSIRKGYPDFIFYKEDKKGNLFDIQFIEHKLNYDTLTKEQKIFKKICDTLKLNYKIIKELNPNKEYTTVRVSWKVKEELLTHAVGRETDDDVLRRVLKMHQSKVKKHEESPEEREFIKKVNSPKRGRIR